MNSNNLSNPFHVIVCSNCVAIKDGRYWSSFTQYVDHLAMSRRRRLIVTNQLFFEMPLFDQGRRAKVAVEFTMFSYEVNDPFWLRLYLVIPFCNSIIIQVVPFYLS
jgi:hypothetical protein